MLQYRNKDDRYESQYFTIEILSNGMFSWNNEDEAKFALFYQMEGQSSWFPFRPNTYVCVFKGTRIHFKGKICNSDGSEYYYIGRIASNAFFNVYGNIMSLFYDDEFEGKREWPMGVTASGLFSYTSVVSAENLVIPIDSVDVYGCFSSLFLYCKSLTKGPRLQAKYLASRAYLSMFYGCCMLFEAPQICAEKIGDYSMKSMFESCKSLTEAPMLHVIELGCGSLYGMFAECSELKKAYPLLPKHLAEACYKYMFYKCCKLKEAPRIGAKFLAKHSLARMFEDCCSLRSAPHRMTVFCGLEGSGYISMYDSCNVLEEKTNFIEINGT